MKFKIIAAACAVLCSASAFAAPLVIGTDPVQRTFYIGGASAQQNGLSVVVPADMFANPLDVIKVTSPGTTQKAIGWFGKSKTLVTGGVSQNLFVVYNSTNGSAAGVAQLRVGATTAEADVVTLNTCGSVTGGSGTWAVTCTSHAPTPIDMALADVNPSELVPGVLPATIGGRTYTAPFKTALQGFGVVVNPALYAALQNAQGLTGCAGNVTSAACQPSIRRADYASLISNEAGGFKDAGSLLGNGDTTSLTLVRRTDSSGTQASSNIFFANNACGLAGFFGANTPAGAGDYPVSTPGADAFAITEQTGTGAVKTALTDTSSSVHGTPGYALGVISLENVASTSPLSWQYVKIDGVSPNFRKDATTSAIIADPFNRENMANGSYPFAYEMSAQYMTNPPAPNTVALATAVINGLKDSTKHNLVGIAYLDGVATYENADNNNKGAKVNRGGNNCAPLIVQ